jgi:hypothetical protein
MVRIAAALLFLVAGVSASHAAFTCHVPPFKLIPGVTVTAVMYVTPGQRCAIAVSNSTGGTLSHDITRQPSNGKIEIYGLNIRYTPRSGFSGKDSFSYVRHALDHRTNSPITLPVDVDVIVAAQ